MNSKYRRSFFAIIWYFLARWNPRGSLFHWRSFLLRIFGAKIKGVVYVYPSVEIWDPKNLTMDYGATIDESVLIYNVAKISIGARAIISRNATLCTATHNYNLNTFDLVAKPIVIENDAWICMDAFVAPGIIVQPFGVALARSVILNNISSYEVHAGNPAKLRNIRKKVKQQYT
ncbi:MAG: putative colanic acid biosynthesis acetyltransferase [Crocinitomicaceae bacterium]|nr:putative colanic acid biosynthesis acetyltransferase [Crocinitomicaceae bacterium]|tara:strand:- start:165 stop:686 length:522 start_codon:yes stop_codon:yes gene_type:complete